MIVVKNNILPFPGFKAMTVWPFIFVRSNNFDAIDENHESIHGRQQVEMLIIPFFLWYAIEWLLRSVFGSGNAYRKISFECESYDNEIDMNYLKNRRFWAFLKYMKR